MMRIEIFVIALTAMAFFANCSSKSEGSATTATGSSGATTLTVQITGATAGRAISLRVVNESTRRAVSGYNFDFTPTGDKADASGNYSKNVTGLISGVNYTIVVRSDVNNNNEQDTNDLGQVLTGVQPGTTANFNNLQTLSTLGANASTDAALANKNAGCILGKQDYQSSDLTAGTNIGYVGSVAILYNASGVPAILATYTTASLSPLSRRAIMSHVLALQGVPLSDGAGLHGNRRPGLV